MMTADVSEQGQVGTAIAALRWMAERKRHAGELWLFRGQSRHFPTMYPSLMRPNCTEEERQIWWSVMRKFVGARAGLTGYGIEDPHDALAVLQHYLLRSPVLDFTGLPAVALYFALGSPTLDTTRMVYAVKASALKVEGLVVKDHTLLTLPLEHGGLQHRWLRQDGYTVGHRDWDNFSSAGRLDFSTLPHLESFAFRLGHGEEALVSHLGDLESLDDDPLASKVRSHFESVAGPDLLEIVRRLMPTTGTRDAAAELRQEVDRFIAEAQRLGAASDLLIQLQRIRQAIGMTYWDMGWDASLEDAAAKLQALGRR